MVYWFIIVLTLHSASDHNTGYKMENDRDVLNLLQYCSASRGPEVELCILHVYHCGLGINGDARFWVVSF